MDTSERIRLYFPPPFHRHRRSPPPAASRSASALPALADAATLAAQPWDDDAARNPTRSTPGS